MASLNSVTLIGNIGKDPEIRMTPSGQKVANYALATSERYKDKSGQMQDKTEWHSIVAWGSNADFAERNLRKGLNIYINGKIQTRSWDDIATGKKVYKTEIVASDVLILTPKNSGNGESFGGVYNNASHDSTTDDLPF